MKFNWGHGITIFIIAFVGFILLMVVKAFNTSTDLTAENYYSQELSYGDRITAISNAQAMKSQVVVNIGDKYMEVTLPETLLANGAEGQLYFYRPDDAKRDFTVEIDPTKNVQVISMKQFVSGNYSLRVSCVVADKTYYFEQTVTINK